MPIPEEGPLAAGLFDASCVIELELKLDPGLVRGVVAITHGWGNGATSGMRFARKTAGANANALLPIGPGSFEPLSSQAFMTGVPVELGPAAPEAVPSP